MEITETALPARCCTIALERPITVRNKFDEQFKMLSSVLVLWSMDFVDSTASVRRGQLKFDGTRAETRFCL